MFLMRRMLILSWILIMTLKSRTQPRHLVQHWLIGMLLLLAMERQLLVQANFYYLILPCSFGKISYVEYLGYIHKFTLLIFILYTLQYVNLLSCIKGNFIFLCLKASSSSGPSNLNTVQHFMDMGFPEELVTRAIKENGICQDYIFI